jgi:hypothetical protein
VTARATRGLERRGRLRTCSAWRRIMDPSLPGRLRSAPLPWIGVTGMPILGLLLGRSLASSLRRKAGIHGHVCLIPELQRDRSKAGYGRSPKQHTGRSQWVRAADSNGDSNGGSQSLPWTHDNILCRSNTRLSG